MVDVTFTDRTSLVVDPPDGRIPALTPAAQAREAAVDRGWEFKDRAGGSQQHPPLHHDRGAATRRELRGRAVHPSIRIVQTPTHLAFISEAFTTRGSFPTETGRICPTTSVSGTATPAATGRATRSSWRRPTSPPTATTGGSTDGLHLVERFTRSGPDTLAYRVTLTDPEAWASSWTAEVPLQRRDQPIYEFACHEGNYSIVGMLRTARLEDANR